MNRARDTFWVFLGLLALLGAAHLLKLLLEQGTVPVVVACVAGGFLLLLTILFSALAVRLAPGLRGLWAALVVAGLACFALVWSDLPGQVPLIGALWQRGGVAQHLLGVILLVSWWCFVLIDQRYHDTAVEARSIARVREQLLRKGDELDRRLLLLALDETSPGQAGFLRRRLQILIDNAATLDQAAWLMAEEAGVDAARLHASHGPLRAIVWALPALGFIGTAAAMAASIAGVGGVMQDGTAPEAQLALLGQVVPNLADAFGITLVALASTIVCYFLLSLLCTREENVLLDTNALVLEALARLQAAHAPGQPADHSDRLLAEMWSLQQEIARLNGQVDRLLNGRGYSETLSAYLYAIATQLKLLHDSASAPLACANGQPSVLLDIKGHLETLNGLLAAGKHPAPPARGNGAARTEGHRED
jgi:biopolymer transport protein ExbB/TolQ